MKADQLLSDRQRAELEFLANRTTAHSEVRNGKRVWVDTYRYGPRKGEEYVMPDYTTTTKTKTTQAAPSLFQQVVLAAGMFGAAIVIYFWIIGP